MTMKRTKKLRLRLYDEARLVEKWDIRFSWLNFIIIILLTVSICVVIGIGIVWFTSLKTKLPGYMKESQRTASADMLLRLDSLIDVNEKNQRYLDNIAAILGSDTIPVDTAAGKYYHGHFTPDSLSTASEKEIQYVLTQQQKKESQRNALLGAEFGHINIANLSPEGESSGLIPKTKKLKMKVGAKEDIGAIGDGIVLSVFPQNKDNYVLMVQHPGGYLSSVTGISQLKVKEGEAVKASAPVGIASAETVTVQLWKDGIGLNPEDYINRKK